MFEKKVAPNKLKISMSIELGLTSSKMQTMFPQRQGLTRKLNLKFRILEFRKIMNLKNPFFMEIMGMGDHWKVEIHNAKSHEEFRILEFRKS